MLHRSVVGSMERAIGHLIDVHGGAFPAWLAPVQLVILPVSAAELDQAGALLRRAVDQGLRAQVSDPGDGSLRIAVVGRPDDDPWPVSRARCRRIERCSSMARSPRSGWVSRGQKGNGSVSMTF